MGSSLDDIEKLTHILHMNDSDSDSASIDSNELLVDCELYDILKNSKDNVIKKCKDPLLKQALICNIKKRRILQQIISKLEEHLNKLKNIHREHRLKLVANNKPLKKLIQIKKRLGAPYFKDADMFPSPPNKDVLERDKERINMNYLTINAWTKEDKLNLYTGVVKEVCECKLAEINKQLKNADDYDLKKLLHEKIIFENADLITKLCKSFNKFNEKSENENDEEIILQTVCNWDKKIDWLKISNYYVDVRHNDIECKAMWNCYVNPKYSKERWSQTENKRLAELCEVHNYQNWEAIAFELQTNRSPYQCCVHFHAKICEKFNRDKWTPEEDVYLESVIEKCSTGKYISWGKVAFYFKYRTKMQIYRHYVNCISKKIKKGSFSIEEDILLLVAMKIYNNNCGKVHAHFPNRLQIQLRNRMRTLNTDTTRPWTPQEDLKIITSVSQHGIKNWQNLTNDIRRSDGCIRHRYKIIKRYFDMNPAGSIADIPRRENSTRRSKHRKRLLVVRKVVGFLLHKFRKSQEKSEVLNLEYIKNILSPFLRGRSSKENTDQSNNKSTELNINCLLAEFFQSSYKCLVNRQVFTDEIIERVADRIEILLQMFNANVIFPPSDQIENHPLLDEDDKRIITRIVEKRQNTKVNLQHFSNVIPPSVENVIGFRGILLLMPLLKCHSRCKYIGYTIYVRTGPNSDYPKKGYHLIRHELDQKLANVDENSKQIALRDNQLFFKRLQMLFQWVFILADTNIESDVMNQNFKIESLKEKSKPGRPSKKDRNYKIKLMNEARKNAAQKRKLENEAEPGPSGKIPKLM